MGLPGPGYGRPNPQLPSEMEVADEVFRTESVDILAGDQPDTFLFFFSVPLAIDSRFENVKFSPLGFFDWYPGILDWYVPEGRRKYGRSGSGQARSPDTDRHQMN